MNKKTILAFFVLMASVFATTVQNANFRGPYDPGGTIYRFDTDLQFTTDFTLSVVSGEVLPGVDKNNLQNGDEVCTGATIKATPSVNAKWAVSKLDLSLWYPNCAGGGACPAATIPYTTVNHNRNIKWLPAAVYDSHDSYGDINDWSQSRPRYDQLASFYDQTAQYHSDEADHYNKKAQANIFCKGTIRVLDNGNQKDTEALPSTSLSPFQVTGSGTSHLIKVEIINSACLGVGVKLPTEYGQPSPDFFMMSYYSKTQPSIPSPMAASTRSITVMDSGGTCDIDRQTVAASSSLTAEELIMVKVTVKNNGDPAEVTGVIGTNPDYTVMEFPTSLCAALGFPPVLCPASNGFNEQIGSGAYKNLYVLVQRQPGASGGTILLFSAQTISQSCGGADTCAEIVDLTGPITCEIDPSSLSYGTHEVAEFLVTCRDLAGDPIPCVGDNWYWTGMSGGFLEKDSTHALAYPTSSTGSSGKLNYLSGIAYCYSDITVTAPGDDPDNDYECELIPSSADMATNEEKYFVLNCFMSGLPSTPDDADYDTIGGLSGTTSNSSVHGTTFTAGVPSIGDLRAYAFWNIPGDDPVLGAVAFSHITIDGGGGNATNQTDGVDENDGTSIWCKINTGPLDNIYPGYQGWVPIYCGKTHDQECDEVSWQGMGAVSLKDGDTNGTYFEATGKPGQSGQIHACVKFDGDEGCCWRGFNILEPDCWEFS